MPRQTEWIRNCWVSLWGLCTKEENTGCCCIMGKGILIESDRFGGEEPNERRGGLIRGRWMAWPTKQKEIEGINDDYL